MEKSSVYLEIFSGDGLDEIAPQIHPTLAKEPATPLDNPLFDFLPGSGKAGALARELADVRLIQEIAGIEESEAKKIIAPPAPPVISSDLLSKLVKRATHGQRTAPLRKRAVQDIIDQFRSQLRKYEARSDVSSAEFDEMYACLARSCENFCRTAVLTA